MKYKSRRHFLAYVLILVLSFSLGLNLLFIFQSYQRNIVIQVVDGDSVDLADGRRIRLLGLDAPERGRCMYDAARSRLTELVQGRHVRLKNTVTDDYGRTLAYVIVEEPLAWVKYILNRIGLISQIRPIYTTDPFLNRVMARAGLVVFSGSHDEYYGALKSASEMAKAQQLGIYAARCRSAVPERPECAIKGNTREGKKMYYLPNCRYYDQVIVDQSYGDAWFCDEPAAQAAGYGKAANCP